MTARGGSRWTDRIIELADEIDAADLRGDGRIQQACVKLREVARSFPAREPDDGRLVEERVARAIKKAIHLPCGITGDPNVDAALHLELARAAVAAVRAAEEENPE